MRRAGPPRYFQEEGDEAVFVSLFLRGNLEDVSAVVETIRRGLEAEYSAAGGELLAELTVAEEELRKYDESIRAVLELDLGVEDE